MSEAKKPVEPFNPHKFSKDEDDVEKAQRKIKENPMVPLGMLGFFTAVGYGFYGYKKRPAHMNLSMYVMRFRVFAQSIAVGAICVGVGYNIAKNTFLKDDTIRKDK